MVETDSSIPSRAYCSLCRWSGWWLAYFSTTIIANRLGPAKPRDRVEGSRRLGDRLARPAAELLPHMLGHEPLPRDYIECLDDILANLGRCHIDRAFNPHPRPARKLDLDHPRAR